MTRSTDRITALIILAALALSACNMPVRATPTESGASAIYTAAAQTVEAQLTRVSGPAATSAGATPSPTSQITQVTGITPTATQAAPAATATPKPCDRVEFVEDVTYPDNSLVDPGETFVKTWRLKNAGSCTWTTGYYLVFTGGEPMGTPAEVSLPRQVAPGDTIDLSVSLTAPASGGTYRGDYKLRNESNQVFGLGPEDKPFWVQIQVRVISGITYDFLVQASGAEWTSGVGDQPGEELAFNGPDDDPEGVAKIKDQVRLETGAISGKILLTYPRREDNGVVSGLYPAYVVQDGDRLKARLGFMIPGGGGGCGSGRVEFQINYLVEDDLKQLGTWDKTCNGSLLPIDIDLSSLKGESVQFALVVKAKGSSTDDWAIWNSPLIEH
jgi:hypothetical protein